MVKQSSIYIITSHSSRKFERKISKDKIILCPAHSRSWGYYFSEQEAIEAVEANISDLYECGYYNFVTIEEVNPGLIAFSSKTLFYRWDLSSSKWKKVHHRPNWAKDTVNFALG